MQVGGAHGVAIARGSREGRDIAVGGDGLGENSARGLQQAYAFGGWRNDFRGLLFDNTARIFKTQHQRFSRNSLHEGMIDQAVRHCSSLANRRTRGYTFGMKTAVSIPNELFDMAERLARRTRKSRSRLFSDALREYVARRSPDKVTEAMDQAMAEIGKSNDLFVAAASRRRLVQSEW